MKNLDLNGYGVQEMDAKAVKETNGGILPFLIGLAAGAILSDWSGFKKGIRDAWNENN